MKNIILFTPILIILVGCGPSPEEKQEIATVTCNFILETRNMDSAIRLKAINEARDQIGEDKFLGSDDDIKESVQFNLCEELVLNDPDYESILLYIDNVAEEKKHTRMKLENVRAARRFNEGVKEYFFKYPPKPKLKNFSDGELFRLEIKENLGARIGLKLFCSSLGGFDYKITIEYINNLGYTSIYNPGNRLVRCRGKALQEVALHENINVLDRGDSREDGNNGKELSDKIWEIRQLPEEDQKKAFKSIIKNISLELTGNTNVFYDWIPPDDVRMVSGSTYMPMNEQGFEFNKWIEDPKFTTRYEFQLYPVE